MSEYAQLRPEVPTVYRLSGNQGGALVFKSTYLWLSVDDYSYLVSLAQSEYNNSLKAEESTKAQVSEDFILKLLAIGKDSSLAIPLLKKD